MIRLKHFIPDIYVNSIKEIDFEKLYSDGKKLILCDLDNTLISYMEKEPTEELIFWKNKILSMGFEFVIVSNSRKNRVEHFATMLEVPFVKFAKKPLSGGLKKGIRLAKNKYTSNQIVEIGDQLMTDVAGSKKIGIYTVLVKAIDRKTEVLPTRINRFFERRLIHFLKRRYKEDFNRTLRKYEENNYGR